MQLCCPFLLYSAFYAGICTTDEKERYYAYQFIEYSTVHENMLEHKKKQIQHLIDVIDQANKCDVSFACEIIGTATLGKIENFTECRILLRILTFQRPNLIIK